MTTIEVLVAGLSVSPLGYPKSPEHWILGEEPCLFPSIPSSHVILFFLWSSKDFLPNKAKLVQIRVMLSWLVIHSQVFTFSGAPFVRGTVPASLASLAIITQPGDLLLLSEEMSAAPWVTQLNLFSAFRSFYSGTSNMGMSHGCGCVVVGISLF